MACTVNVTGGTLEKQEIDAYIARAKEKFGREPYGIDILVDGPFILDKKDIRLRFRGSVNQRVIDVPETLKTGDIVISHYSVKD